MTAPVCCGARDYRPATKPRSRKRSHPRQRAARGKTKTSPPPETPPRKEKREDKNSVKAHPLAARVIWLKHLSWPPRPSIQRGVAPSPARPTRPSSRGLGRRPFTAKTGVRIPLGAPIKSITYDFFIVDKTKNTENIRKICFVKTTNFTKNCQKISART